MVAVPGDASASRTGGVGRDPRPCRRGGLSPGEPVRAARAPGRARRPRCGSSAPSLARTWATCHFAVPAETPSSAATCALRAPVARSRSTSRSLAVSDSTSSPRGPTRTDVPRRTIPRGASSSRTAVRTFDAKPGARRHLPARAAASGRRRRSAGRSRRVPPGGPRATGRRAPSRGCPRRGPRTAVRSTAEIRSGTVPQASKVARAGSRARNASAVRPWASLTLATVVSAEARSIASSGDPAGASVRASSAHRDAQARSPWARRTRASVSPASDGNAMAGAGPRSRMASAPRASPVAWRARAIAGSAQPSTSRPTPSDSAAASPRSSSPRASTTSPPSKRAIPSVRRAGHATASGSPPGPGCAASTRRATSSASSRRPVATSACPSGLTAGSTAIGSPDASAASNAARSVSSEAATSPRASCASPAAWSPRDRNRSSSPTCSIPSRARDSASGRIVVPTSASSTSSLPRAADGSPGVAVARAATAAPPARSPV